MTSKQILDVTADLEAIEAALNGELSLDDIEIDPSDFDDADIDVVEEEIEAAAIEESVLDGLEEVADTIELSEEDIAPVVEEVEAADEGDVIEDIAPVIEEEKPAKAQKKEEKIAKPQRTKLGFEDSVVALLGADPVLDSELADAPLTEDAVRAIAKSVTQVKVREKVTNLLEAINTGGKPSVYTEIALSEVLIPAFLDGCKPVAIADIKAAYRKRGYKDGTVAAQSGQMTPLFECLQIVKRGERGVIVPNANSVLLDILATSR